MYKPALIAGITLAGLAVVLGAFAAHGLTKVLTPEKIDVFQKGVTYQFYHSFALVLVGIVYASFPNKQLETAVPLFIGGIICFSGSLYLYPLLEAKNISIPTIARLITPVGGLLFITGWVSFLLGMIKNN